MSTKNLYRQNTQISMNMYKYIYIFSNLEIKVCLSLNCKIHTLKLYILFDKIYF